MGLRLLSGVFAVCLLAATQGTVTVQQLLEFLRSSIQMKQADKDVAKFVSTMKLSERLDDRTIEQLQGEGLGPKTVAALHALRDLTGSLPEPKPVVPPPQPKPIPPPSSEEQGRIIAEARELSLNYSNRLPDYICLEVTRRYFNPYGNEPSILADTVTARLSYFDKHEEYKLVSVNNQVTNQSYESLGGASSRGDFGTMLQKIFEHRSHTQFDWDHWALLRKRVTYVFQFRVPLETSDYIIDYEHRQQVTVGYRGLIYIDKETNMVIRIKMECENIPPDFPIQQAGTQLDYGYEKIGDQEFLLPLTAEVRMRHDKYHIKNVKEFRLYRKFSADATIKFEDTPPPPLTDEQTKEQKPPK